MTVDHVARTRPVASGAAGVQVVDLAKVYDTRTGPLLVFDRLSLDVPPGAFVAIVGPSGCGKTTLLLSLAGLLEPTSGEVRVGGERVDAPSPDRLGVIFQDPNLLPWRSVLDNVAFPLELRGVPKSERHARARGFLDLVRLGDFLHAYPTELSGGMKQRAAIARGLIQDPKVLLMDEPFAALDEQTRMKMGAEVLRIWEATHKTVVFVTHNLTEAVFLSDEVVVLGTRPATVLDRVTVDLPRPRTYDVMATEQFGRLRDRIWRQIMDME
ncbi:MAG TPA: ABC transporter ATP-binding protein [Chloroflexota bacterium]|nr:ABC transporter ATP-binding protein [Chloroflexota bacterium]